MRAWQVTRTGPPEQVLEIADRPPPEPIAGELGARVHAAAIGLPDLLMCTGGYEFKPAHPFTPGQEVAATITDASQAPGFEAGQRVMGVTAFYRGAGGFAQHALLVAGSSWPIPEAMSDIEAAAFGIAFRTAYLGLVVRAGLRPGETLLVHGAAGGTGFAAIQLAKAAIGARVLAVASGEEKCAFCLEQGADAVIDRSRQDFVEATRDLTDGAGADVIFDPVGGETFLRSLDCIATGGRLLAIGFASGAWADAPTARLVRQNVSVVGAVAVAPSEDVAGEMHRTLSELHERGAIRSIVSRVLDFEDLPIALASLDAGGAIGKQVLRVD